MLKDLTLLQSHCNIQNIRAHKFAQAATSMQCPVICLSETAGENIFFLQPAHTKLTFLDGDV